MKVKIEWPTGHMDLNIDKFFGTADKRRIGKVLRLARQNCSDSWRVELIGLLKNEIEARTKALDRCGELEFEREQILTPFFGLMLKQALRSEEKKLVSQRDRMSWVVEQLEKERWD